VKAIRRGLITTVGVIVAALALSATAGAHVAEVTTSVPLAEVRDEDSLRRTIGKAVDKARSETIAFEPSVVAVTSVRVHGERLLIGLLFADQDGEAMLETLQSPHGADGGRDGEAPDPDSTASRELRI
jgi:hypothetical protein